MDSVRTKVLAELNNVKLIMFLDEVDEIFAINRLELLSEGSKIVLKRAKRNSYKIIST